MYDAYLILQFITQTKKIIRNGLREKLRLVNKEECEICEKAWSVLFLFSIFFFSFLFFLFADLLLIYYSLFNIYYLIYLLFIVPGPVKNTLIQCHGF